MLKNKPFFMKEKKHYEKESMEKLNDCSLPFETYMKEVCLVYLRKCFPRTLRFIVHPQVNVNVTECFVYLFSPLLESCSNYVSS